MHSKSTLVENKVMLEEIMCHDSKAVLSSFLVLLLAWLISSYLTPPTSDTSSLLSGGLSLQRFVERNVLYCTVGST